MLQNRTAPLSVADGASLLARMIPQPAWSSLKIFN